ncbi:MAG: dihydrodipicolinate synthase family protein [Planctomycetales bacterium]
MTRLPRGIISVVQTPFLSNLTLDLESLRRLIADALDADVDGFLVPAVASEVGTLTGEERQQILACVLETTRSRVPVIAGASSPAPQISRDLGLQAEEMGASAWLIAVPDPLYRSPDDILPFFKAATEGISLPLVIQDLQFNGPGLTLDDMRKLSDALPQLAGWKIETVPAGPKYSLVRQAFGPRCHISGGWAVPQLIEALDRGVDAMIPESAMIRIYKKIYRRYQAGNRGSATELFRRLQPILAFTNQEILTSIAFFKRLLVRKGIFREDAVRVTGFQWDRWNERIAEELIALYLQLEQETAA